MKESREKLLKQIYDYDQNFGGPYQFDSDGTEVGIDMLTLRNDVDYLKDKKYVIKTTSPLSTYRLSLTEKNKFLLNGKPIKNATEITIRITPNDIPEATITVMCETDMVLNNCELADS